MSTNGLTPLSDSIPAVVSGITKPTGAHLYAVGDKFSLPQGRFVIDKVSETFVEGHYPPYDRSRTYKIADLDRRLNGDGYEADQIIRLLDRRELHILQVTDVDAHMVREVDADGKAGSNLNWRHQRILDWIGDSSHELITLPDPEPVAPAMPDTDIKAVVDAKRATDTQEGLIVAQEWVAVGRLVRVKKTGQVGVIERLGEIGLAVRGNDDTWYEATLTPAELEPMDEDIDTNPFETILNSEIVTLQEQVEQLQDQLQAALERARYAEEIRDRIEAQIPMPTAVKFDHANFPVARAESWVELAAKINQGSRIAFEQFVVVDGKVHYAARLECPARMIDAIVPVSTTVAANLSADEPVELVAGVA